MREEGARRRRHLATVWLALLLALASCAAPPAPAPTPAPPGAPPASTPLPDPPGAARLVVGPGQRLATLDAARDELRRMRAAGGLPRGAVVEVLAGVYPRAAPLELGPEDGGAPGAPVVYRAAPGAEARIVGGKLLDLARATAPDPAAAARLSPAARAHVLRLDLPAQGVTDFGKLSERTSGYATPAALELVYGGRPLPLAQWPDPGQWARLDGPPGELRRGSLRFPGGRPDAWADRSDVWVHGFFSADWTDRYERVTSFDLAARTATTTLAGFEWATYLAGQRFAFLNVLEELDTPGEWFLDRASGALYVWPPDPAAAEAYVTLGDGPVLLVRGARFVTVEGLTVEGGRGAAVQVDGGADVLLRGLTVRNAGTDGVTISGERVGLVGSSISDVGDAGVRVTGGDRATLAPSQNDVLGNRIVRYARFVLTGRPGVMVSGVGVRVAGNLIADAPAIGVQYSGNDHLIELNEIARVCRLTSDVGAIYTGGSWASQGNVVRNNYLHDLDLAPKLPDTNGCQGVYLDNYSSGTSVLGNVFVRSGARAVFVNSGPLNRVEGNIVADTPVGVYVQHRDWEDLPPGILAELDEVRFREPPYRDRYPALASIRDVPAEQLRWPRGTVVSGNVFVGVAEPLRRPPGLPASVVEDVGNASRPLDDPAYAPLLAGRLSLPAAGVAIPAGRIGPDGFRP